jgi:hypothetical protein
MDHEQGSSERVDVYDAWWRKRRPTRAWAARYDDEDRYDRVKELLAARAAKLLEERNAKAERERLEKEALADRVRARRSGGIAAVLTVVAILALVAALYSIRQRAIAVSAESAAIASAQRATTAEQKAVALQVYVKKLEEQRVQTMAARNTVLQQQRNIAQKQRNIAQTESDLANRYASVLQTTSEGGELGRMAEGLWDNGDQRVAGLLGADAYMLDNTGVNARESLLESAVLPDALGAVALPPWNLGAVAGGGLEIAVLAGQRQASYGQPITGSLVTVDAATLAVRSRTPDVHGSFMCGFDALGRVVIASDGRLDEYDLTPTAGAARVASMSTGPVQALACSPQGETAYYVDAQGTLRGAGFNGSPSVSIGRIAGQANGLIASDTGRLAAVTTTAGDVTVFALATHKVLIQKRMFADVERDCLSTAGCTGALAFEENDGDMSWYDAGRINARTIDGRTVVSFPCAPALCDHPSLVYLGASVLPSVVTQSVLGYVSTKKDYEKAYADIAGTAVHALLDRELKEYVIPYNPETADAPNPLGSGLAVGALILESAPMIGRIGTSQWSGSYILRGHDLVLAAANGYYTYDLDRLREQFTTSFSPSYAIRVRDGGVVRMPDGQVRHDAVAFNYQTGVVQILDVRTDPPAVIHQFKTARVQVKNNLYQENVQLGYDARTGVVAFLSDDSLRRFTDQGRLISSLSRPQILRLAQLHSTAAQLNWELSERGNFVILHVPNQSDVLMDANGRVVGQDYVIDYLTPDETRAFGFEEKGKRDVAHAYELPSWTLLPGGVLPISSGASYLGLAPNGKLLAYYDSSADNPIQLYDVSSRSLFQYNLPVPPDESQYWDFAFSDDDRYLMIHYKGSDGGYYTAIYALDPQTWMRAACLMAGRPLSLQEFQANVGTQIPYVNACAPYASQMYRW